MAKIDLYDFKNAQFTGDLSIGDQSQTFQVIYDTGSANTWINSALCSDPGCTNHKQYDNSKSKSFKKVGIDLDVQFGTGSLRGQINQDTVNIGGIEIDEQMFSEIVTEDGDVFKDSNFDGIVGLAFPKLAAYNTLPLFDNIMKQQKLDQNIFSFYMDNQPDGKTSKLTLGGIDHSLYNGEIQYHKVVDEQYWLIDIEQIYVGGNDVGICGSGKKCRAMADSGTSLIAGPTDDLIKMVDGIDLQDDCGGTENLPSITFMIDGFRYTLEPEDYVLSVADDDTIYTYGKMSQEQKKRGQCTGAFMPLDVPTGKTWILGDIFLQKYYSVYDRDNSRVGFAEAKRK